jgi:hypothetical protein
VLPIWEGTTNVLALDTLRALSEGRQGWNALKDRVRQGVEAARDARLREAGQKAGAALAHAEAWSQQAAQAGGAMLEIGARRFSMTIGRVLELALLVEHAQWSLEHERDQRPRAAALRFALAPIDLIADVDAGDAQLLMNDS